MANATYPGDALARRAWDVMLRRGWLPRRYDDGSWGVQDADGLFPRGLMGWRTYRQRGEGPFGEPFTPLVEADRWMTEQETKESK